MTYVIWAYKTNLAPPHFFEVPENSFTFWLTITEYPYLK